MKLTFPYRLTLLLSVAWTAVMCSSCIGEDLSGCPPRVLDLTVIFTDPYGNRGPDYGITAGELPGTTLFIYDQAGDLVNSTGLTASKLDRDYLLDMGLSSGTYDFIAWSTTNDLYYEYKDTGKLDLASVNLHIDANKMVRYQVPALYYGKVSFSVKPGEQLIEIPVLQCANHIHYTVEGYGTGNDDLTLSIKDDNGKYNFHNSFMPYGMFEYISEDMVFSKGKYSSELTILRLKDNRSPVLELRDNKTGKVVYPSYEGQETNLVSLIKKAYGNTVIDFDAKHTYHISLVFDVNMHATVYIDNWEVKDDDYIL